MARVPHSVHSQAILSSPSTRLGGSTSPSYALHVPCYSNRIGGPSRSHTEWIADRPDKPPDTVTPWQDSAAPPLYSRAGGVPKVLICIYLAPARSATPLRTLTCSLRRRSLARCETIVILLTRGDCAIGAAVTLASLLVLRWIMGEGVVSQQHAGFLLCNVHTRYLLTMQLEAS